MLGVRSCRKLTSSIRSAYGRSAAATYSNPSGGKDVFELLRPSIGIDAQDVAKHGDRLPIWSAGQGQTAEHRCGPLKTGSHSATRREWFRRQDGVVTAPILDERKYTKAGIILRLPPAGPSENDVSVPRGVGTRSNWGGFSSSVVEGCVVSSAAGGSLDASWRAMPHAVEYEEEARLFEKAELLAMADF